MFKEGVADTTDDWFAGVTRLHIVLNSFEELQARVPTGR